MAKPAKHYDKWRIRWTDETGKRRSKTFTERKTAELALRKVEIEVEERRRGLRRENRAPAFRGGCGVLAPASGTAQAQRKG